MAKEFIKRTEEEEVDIAKSKKKSHMGKLKPTSSINKEFCPETQIFANIEIAQAVSNLKKLCRRNGMPVFVVVEDPATGKRESDFITPYEIGVKVDNDIVADCIKLSNGFHVTQDAPAIVNMEDLN